MPLPSSTTVPSATLVPSGLGAFSPGSEPVPSGSTAPPIPYLAYELTTIPRPEDPPVTLARIGPRIGNNVEVPLKDHRLAKCVIPMDDPAAALLMDLENNRDQTMRIALKARYVVPEFDSSGAVTGTRKQLAFWGPIRRPEFDYDTGLVTINAVGPSFRMEKAFVVAGDPALDPGITLDGDGLFSLLGMAQNRPVQDSSNWPSLGIVEGTDTSTPRAGSEVKMRLYDQIWSEGFQNFADSVICPDFDVEPLESSLADIAIGVVDTTGAVTIAASDWTYVTLPSSLPGVVQRLRIGVWLKARYPDQIRLFLNPPAGTPSSTLWTDLAGVPSADLGSGAADMFGAGDLTDDELCFFQDAGESIYADFAYPRVGRFAADFPPSDSFAGFDASGDWVLAIRNFSATPGTLEFASLRFEGPVPTYARLNVFDKPDTDAPVIAAIFHHGWGKENAKTMLVATEGGALVNQVIMVPTNGDQDTDVVRDDAAARAEYGTYQAAEPSGQKDTTTQLQGKADARVKAYARPPMTPGPFQPADDSGQPQLPRFLYDYAIGDHLRAVAKRGNCRHSVVARVTRGVLTQLAGGVQTELELLPTVGTSAELGDA